jgi:DNA polymerase
LSALAAVEADIRAHGGCGLDPCTTAHNPVPGEGNPRAEVLIVGEAPGAREDAEGRPFVGPAGKLLDALLADAGLAREDVYITNVLKHRPPGNRDPRKAEVSHELPWLRAQAEAIQPRLIVTLGRHALDALALGHKVTKDHGQVLEHDGWTLYPTFHPAAGLRTPAVRALLHEDFARLPDALARTGAPTR